MLQTTTLNRFIGKVDTMIINPLILFLFALAVVYFLYGVLDFLMNQENEENMALKLINPISTEDQRRNSFDKISNNEEISWELHPFDNVKFIV